MTQSVLLSFNGMQDPFSKSGEDGPILHLLRHRPADFQKVCLFHTPQLKEKAASTLAEIHKRHRNIQTVLPCELSISDPTDYGQILEALRRKLLRIYDAAARYTISLSSGTPQMHACWFFLVASSEIRAEIIHVREKRFVRDASALVTEIDPAEAAFPTVRFRQDGPPPPAVNQDEMDTARQEAGIVGRDPVLLECLEKAALVARSDYPVLLLGPSGSGKELFARFIHLMSRRKNETFTGLDCGAIPDSLIESELFGHRKGAFTHADRDKTGAFEQADGGTLFLDEIGNLSEKSQAVLLRTLQTLRVRPLGAQNGDEATVDIRVIAATNADLGNAMRDGGFREDLYYRLNTVEIRLPSLNRRRGDIPELARFFLEEYNHENRTVKELAPDALERLAVQNWRGNARELKSAVIRSAIFCPAERIDADHLDLAGPASGMSTSFLPEPGPGFKIDNFIKTIQKEMALKAIEIAGNKHKAATLLGASHTSVANWLKH